MIAGGRLIGRCKGKETPGGNWIWGKVQLSPHDDNNEYLPQCSYNNICAFVIKYSLIDHSLSAYFSFVTLDSSW